MIKVFHGTSFLNFKSICNDNYMLIANKGKCLNTTNTEYVYLSTTYGTAEAHGYGNGAFKNWEEHGSDPYIVIEFEINSRKLLKDYDNNSECNDWLESALKNSQVSVLHKCSIEKSKVHFIGGDEFTETRKYDIRVAKEHADTIRDAMLVPPCED